MNLGRLVDELVEVTRQIVWPQRAFAQLEVVGDGYGRQSASLSEFVLDGTLKLAELKVRSGADDASDGHCDENSHPHP